MYSGLITLIDDVQDGGASIIVLVGRSISWLVDWLIGVCFLAELYDIFLSRAKEKWRSYSETSSVNDSESGMTVSRHHGQTKVTRVILNLLCVL